MDSSKIISYLGNWQEFAKPAPIFDASILKFLQDVSRRLLQNPLVRAYPDIITFAFWIRKANLKALEAKYREQEVRLGRGTVFHIAPSNVPINFAFSLVFGLLSGNRNVIRVSGKEFPQVRIVCQEMAKVLEQEEFRHLASRICVLSYPHNREITDYFSEQCDIRMIWGGNQTISEIRKSPLSPRAAEICFADRYSLAIIGAERVLSGEDSEILSLAKEFYKDTYLMDQNACSSPHLIAWQSKNLNSEEKEKAAHRFWRAVATAAREWEMKEIHASEKFLSVCRYGILYPEIKTCRQYGNRVYVLELERLTEETVQIRGKYGLFTEIWIEQYQELLPVLGKETQSITYYGVNAAEIAQMVQEEGVAGVDRIVPMGKALELSLNWDGWDLIRSLSRVITVE